MKKLLLITLLIILALKSNAQTYIALEDTSSAYLKVDVDPKFPGGFQMFDKYIDDNSIKILKPGHARGVIVVGFFIEKNGKITNPKIIKRLTPETDSAAVYLLKNSPLWKPGLKNGSPVETYTKIAVKFIYSGNFRPVHVQDVVLSKGQNADVAISYDQKVADVDPPKIYTSVEQVPQFPGGLEKFQLFINQNFNLPPNSNGITGRLIVSFVVELDGSLTDVKISRSLSPDIDKEALRLITQGPKWHPGILNGKSVRVAYSVPVQIPIN